MNIANPMRTIPINMPVVEFGLAVRDSLPILLGIIPFGITCGVMGLTAGLTPLEIILMSVIVFAGASQFISITMLGAGITGCGIIVLTTLLVNLRHLLMGASLAPYMARLPIRLQAILAFGITDESYILTSNRIDKAGYNMHYQLGSNMAIYTIWILSTAIGVFLGSYIPDPLAWGLDFAMPATFLVMLIPRLTDRINLYVCLASGIVAVLGALYLPGKWYIILACLVASVLGGILEGYKKNAE